MTDRPELLRDRLVELRNEKSDIAVKVLRGCVASNQLIVERRDGLLQLWREWLVQPFKLCPMS